MKKLLALLLCLSLVFALAACSTPESQTQQSAEQPAQAEDQPTEPTQTEQPSERFVGSKQRRAITIRCLLPTKRKIPSRGSTPSSRA